MTTQLEKLCGLTNIRVQKPRQLWLPVVLKFLGAENYVLGTKKTELSLTTNDGGFGLMFKNELVVEDRQLLGSQVKEGLLMDIKIRFEPSTSLPELSLASLCPGRYPHVLRTGGVLRVS